MKAFDAEVAGGGTCTLIVSRTREEAEDFLRGDDDDSEDDGLS